MAGAEFLNLTTAQAVPELTNVAVEFWNEGGWLADILAPVKRVTRDKFRFGRWSDQVNKTMGTLDTKRVRGETGNEIMAPGRAWYDGIIEEHQLSASYIDEEVHDSPNPDEPRVSRVKTIVNALRYAVEKKVAAKYDLSVVPSYMQAAVPVSWISDAANRERDVLNAMTEFQRLTGRMPNIMQFGSMTGYNGFVSSKEIKEARGVFYRDITTDPGNPIESYHQMKILKPAARYDNQPGSSTYSPAYVWDTNAVYFGWTPSLNGSPWDGESPVYTGQFEALLTGSAPFQAIEYLDPHYPRNHKHWIVMDFRRDWETIHPYMLMALTGLY